MAADRAHRSSDQGGMTAERPTLPPHARPTRPLDDAGLAIDDPAEASPSREDGDQPRDADREREDKSKQVGVWTRIKRHPVIAILVALVFIGVLVAGVLWWLNARQYENTDDAFIDARPSARA